MAKKESEFVYPISPKEGSWEQELGLTKREYFAAIAMQATDLEKYSIMHGDKWAFRVAIDSILMADTLIDMLKNTSKSS